MKIYSLLIAVFCFGAATIAGRAQNTSLEIKNIQTHFQAINTDTHLQKVNLQGEEFMENVSDGGGELIGYFRNNTLVKVVETIGVSNGKKVSEFYFDHGEVVFIYSVFKAFPYDEKADSFIYTELKTAFETRYYLRNQKVLKQAATGTPPLGDALPYSFEALFSHLKDDLPLIKKKRTEK